jgi:hypothetical protein
VEYELIDITPLPKYRKPAALIRNRVSLQLGRRCEPRSGV